MTHDEPVESALRAVSAAFEQSHATVADALRETKALIETLNEHSIVSEADRTGRIVRVNDAFCRISGYSREELIGQDHRILNSGTHPKSFWIDVWKTIASGRPWRGEVCNRAKDGSLYWVDSIISPCRDTNGQIERYTSIRNDITQRKLAEESLRAVNAALEHSQTIAEDALRETTALIETLNEHSIVSEADRTGRIIRVNDAFCRISGYSREELIGQDHRILNSGTHPKSFWIDVWKTIASGKPWRGEVCNRAKDGSLYWVDSIISPFRGANGQIERYTSIRNDITQRKLAEESLRSMNTALEQSQSIAEDALRETKTLIDTLNEHSIISEADRTGRIIRVNDAFCRISGYSREELIGQDHRILNSGTHPKSFWVDVWKTIASGKAWRGEVCNRAKDGSLYWVDSIISPCRDANGQIERYTSIRNDITQRKLTEESLLKSEAKFRDSSRRLELATRTAGLGVWDWDLKTSKVMYDDAMHTIYGITPSPDHTVEYASWVASVHPDDRAEQDRILTDTVKRRGRSEREFRILRTDGEERVIQAAEAVFVDDAGEAVSVIGVNLDITEFRRTQANLRSLNAALELRVQERTNELLASNRELEQFAYIASHDLQEPLRMVASYTQLLAERYKGKLDEKADGYIHHAVDGATRMQALISDLLAFSRVGKKTGKLTLTDTKELVREVLDGLGKAIEEAGATIVVEESLPTLNAYRSLLGQLFQNLIENAIKYRGTEPPRVAIGATRSASEWVFEVRDNGIGIAPEFHQRIFAIFQRLHERGKYKGTGIGLAVAKKIAESHGGKIWVESALGTGACFRFTIPAQCA